MSLHRAILLAIVVAWAASTAHAQDLIANVDQPTRAGGWVFIPRLSSGAAWDDNVLIQGLTDDRARDRSIVFGPGATLEHVGRLTTVSASYSGLIQRYGTFSDLNNYEQNASASVRRRMSSRVSLFTTQSYAAQPTTALRTVASVPFQRIGSRMLHIVGGVDWTPGKRLSLSSAYDFEHVRFNTGRSPAVSLVGGAAHGGRTELRYRFDPRLTLLVNYEIQRATLRNSNVFTVQNSWAGGDFQLSESTSVFGAFGLSHLAATVRADGSTAPAWRTGLEYRHRRGAVNASYTSTFLPSYGTGGTLSNRQLSGHATFRLTRRLYADATLARQNGATLNPGEIGITSIWLDGVLGYAAQPWLRLEGFYNRQQQDVARPGGRVNRNRIGFQVVTAKPMRIR